MVDYKSYSDNELIQLLNESDHAAYNEIYTRYFHLLFVHAYKKLRDEEQAKDLIQDLFTTLWFNRGAILPSGSCSGYLFTAVRNRVFDVFAHNKVEIKYIDSLKDYLNTHNSIPTDSLVRENQFKAYIDKQISALPPKMRQIFEMSRKENLSYQEIAEQLNVTENNVSKQVNNALRVLKTKLGVILFFCFFLF